MAKIVAGHSNAETNLKGRMAELLVYNILKESG